MTNFCFKARIVIVIAGSVFAWQPARLPRIIGFLRLKKGLKNSCDLSRSGKIFCSYAGGGGMSQELSDRISSRTLKNNKVYEEIMIVLL